MDRVFTLWPSSSVRCLAVGRGTSAQTYVVAMGGMAGLEVGQCVVAKSTAGGINFYSSENDEPTTPTAQEMILQGQPIHTMAFSSQQSRLAIACLTGRIGE